MNPPNLISTVFFIAIIIVNIFGTLGYAEEEFWSSVLKLTVVVMFVLIGIVINCGGGPSDGEFSSYVGGRYWSNPGGFANGFKGVCSVFVTAAFSFGKQLSVCVLASYVLTYRFESAGTELVGLAATETPNPRATMPGAVKGTFWRIVSCTRLQGR